MAMLNSQMVVEQWFPCGNGTGNETIIITDMETRKMEKHEHGNPKKKRRMVRFLLHMADVRFHLIVSMIVHAENDPQPLSRKTTKAPTSFHGSYHLRSTENPISVRCFCWGLPSDAHRGCTREVAWWKQSLIEPASCFLDFQTSIWAFGLVAHVSWNNSAFITHCHCSIQKTGCLEPILVCYTMGIVPRAR